MAEVLLEYLEELKDAKASDADSFGYGERTAYTESLEMIQLWEDAKQIGLDFEIEKSIRCKPVQRIPSKTPPQMIVFCF